MAGSACTAGDDYPVDSHSLAPFGVHAIPSFFVCNLDLTSPIQFIVSNDSKTKIQLPHVKFDLRRFWAFFLAAIFLTICYP